MTGILLYLSARAKKYHDVKDTKSRIVMLTDHLRWILREGEFNFHYYSQGLNAKGTDIAGFMGKKTFSRYRHLYCELVGSHSVGETSGSEDILIKDKFYCSAILRAGGFNTIDNLFLIFNGNFHSMIEAGAFTALEDGDYFLKNTMMESGYGVIGFSVNSGAIVLSDGRSGMAVIEQITSRGRWIVQKRILPHPAIRSVNGSALNTTRLYTISTINGFQFLGGYQAFATGSSETDSWQHGSVYVAIDPFNNRLGRFGITSQSDLREGVIFQHPDSEVVFEGYEIPFLKESVALCCKAHSLFEQTFIIGWDIAITEEGPIIVEANENPGINVLQCFEGGIRRRVKETYRELKRKYNG